MKKAFLTFLLVAAGITCWADEFYIVGDATPWGWVTGNLRKPTQMTETDSPGVYEWTGLLKHGGDSAGNGFYICTNLGGWSAIYPSEQYPISEVGETSYQAETEYKWNPTNTDWQFYTITLNTTEGTISWAAGELFITPDEEGYYNISNAEELYWFSAIVNSNSSLKARLTADIDYTAYQGGMIGNRTQNSRRYSGIFDGQQHTVTIDIKNDARDTGLFGVIDGATIKNLVVEGNAESSDKIIGGLGGLSFGNSTIENIIVKTNVKFTGTGDATMGGIFGDMEAASTVKDCAFYGSFIAPEGENVRSLVSWCSGGIQFSNCLIVPVEIDALGFDYDRLANGSFTVNNCYRMEPEDEALASGEICYLLNGDQSNIGWYQTLGTDDLPVPFSSHSQVYAVGKLKCDGTSDGELSYSNTSTSTVPPHTDEGGWCSVCGALIKEHLIPDAEGYYDIGGPEDLNWFAAIVNEVNQSANARLTDDIDFTGYPYGFIGKTKAFRGTFDGQQHTITVALESDAKIRGLFAKIDGATIKNLIVDGVITSYSYNNIGGLGGQSDGSNTVENVVVKTSVNFTPGTGDASVGGFFPYVNGGSTLVLKNCVFAGSVICGTATGNAGLVAWNSGTIQATGCLIAPAQIEANEFSDYARGNRPETTDCYRAEQGDERLASGEFCYLLNGKQFRNPTWFQTIGEDDIPLPFPNHGIVISCAGSYYSVFTDEDIAALISIIQDYDEELLAEDIIATKALLDEWNNAVESLSEATTILSFADALDALDAAKAAVLKNAAIYLAYIEKCAEVLARLENDKTFKGSLRDALEYYLSDEIGEPDEFNPLGTYEYIIENHVATGEEIEAEIARIEQWLLDAIAEDYRPGTDVSKLIPNGDFAQQGEHWTDIWSNDYAEIPDSNNPGNKVTGVEAWNSAGNMYQTIEGLKPGYYLIGINGAFRPSNLTYSTNYAAGIYANGIFNYFPTVVEDYIAVADAIDQVNCNLYGQGSSDLKVSIYSDFFSTTEEQANDNGATLLGYGVSGTYGMAAAASAGRYKAYTIAHVAEDGILTIGIKNPGTQYGSDWTGWGPIKMMYYGNDENASEALDIVLENMSNRATSIIDYEIDIDAESPAKSPNFPATLREQLQEATLEIEAAKTIEAKANLAKKFSDLFQEVYEGKRAYINLFNFATNLSDIERANLPLVEKDEAGEWNETGERVFTNVECNALIEAAKTMHEAFYDGSCSTEQALNPISMLNENEVEAFAAIVPGMDEQDYYLISNPKQFVTYRAIVCNADRSSKGKLTCDIDMAGIGMQPFSAIFTGTLDGQGHALDNVYINYPGKRCALFYELQNATVKNLSLTGEYHANDKFMGGLTGWTSGNTTIENCEIAVTLYSEVIGDGTHGCVMGVCGGNSNVDVNNCLVNCTLIGPETQYVAGVCGWSDGNLTIRNSLMLSHYDIAEAGLDGSNTVARYKYTVSNVFYAQHSLIGTESGKLATDEQLASGEITYALNGKQSTEPVWFQTLGTDATPQLFNGATVYFADGKYTNEAEPSGDLNGDGKVDIADAVAVLEVMARDGDDAEADLNGDGKVDIADFVAVLEIMAKQ